LATGDGDDFTGRLLGVLPLGWFPSAAPILTAVLSGFAAGWAYIWQLLTYAILQTRVATATDEWLDGISRDFNGGLLPRLTNEQDAAFSARIRANFFAPKNTKAAVVAALVNLTGRTPVIVQPANTGDTGGYTSLTHPHRGGGVGYCVAGAYGSLLLPFQEFITAFRPSGGGIANITGWGTLPISTTGAGTGGAYATVNGTGYMGGQVGAIAYATLSQVQGQVTDADIQSAVVNTIPAGNVAWLRITN
jgi:hypothetical protein